MLLLHLSDLHFGPHSRFKGEEPARLGRSFFRALTQAREHSDFSERIDLVLVTGDIAESGKPKEFTEGLEFLAALAGELGLEHRRFVFVPGNHDISWSLCKKVAADQEEEGFDEAELRRRLDAVKLDRYREFVHGFYGVPDLSAVAEPLPRGAFVHAFPDLRLSVAALNSCERESHRRADHCGLVSREQAEAIMTAWRAGEAARWLKVIAVHHNPWVTTRANIESWREYLLKTGSLDAELIARYESDIVGFEGREFLEAIIEDTKVQLVLHGHHHARDQHNIPWRTNGRAHVLSAGSLCLSAEALPADEPASVRLIRLDIKAREIRARSLIYDPRARPESEVLAGAFVPDPAEPDGYRHQLDLPPNFEVNASAVQTSPFLARPDIEPFLRTYRERLKVAFPGWKLPLTFETRVFAPVMAKLDDMYLPLRFAEGSDFNKLSLGETIGPQDLITRERRLFIRGPAGAGKTTWLAWTFRRLLEPQWNALPLIIFLRDLARLWQDPTYQGNGRSIAGFLDAWVAEHLEHGWDNALHQSYQGENGLRPILLVDGWDEVGDLKDEIERKLLGFADGYPRLLLVITSRPYEEARPYDERFDVLDIQPLSDLEIEELARRFFNHIHGEDEAIAIQELDLFLRALNRSKEAKALARTALLLTMMLLIARSGSLPEERHLLYEKCIEYLLIDLPDRREREGAQLSPHQGSPPTDGEERIRVAAALAAGMQERREHQGSSSVGSWNELMKLLPGEWTERRKSSFLGWLSGPAHLLTPQTDSTLAFTHLSFQDYLAAWHLNATIQEPRQCIEAFRQRLRSPQWWETLRLWAALIDQQDPKRLDVMLEESLVEDDSHGDELCFAGALLADGLGSSTRFENWTKMFCSVLSSRWLSESDLCARSWAMSQQDDRKKMLSNALSQQARGASWPGWLRIQSVSRQALDCQPELPEGIASRALVGQFDGPWGEIEISARRVLCGGPAIWPIDPFEVGWLQLWPSHRRRAALRLQLAVACGASWDDLLALASDILQGEKLSQAAEDRAGHWVHEWAHGWEREWIREWARYWVQFWDLEQTRDQRWAHDWDDYWARGWSREWNCDQAREWAREFARYWGRFWESKWASDQARYWAHEWACRWVRKTGIELQPWLEQFAFYDLASAGRALSRVVAAHARLPEGEPTAPLLALSCRISLTGRPATPAEQLQLFDLARGLDPLWLALAKHLARCSDRADRELLLDLAQHPEKREPPLAWGLRYIVRGDVLLEDGRVVALDQLADEAGVPSVPFLDEMPPELEVNWDSEPA